MSRRKKLSWADVRAVGLDFVELLEETNRRSITDGAKLKYIYNEEFRHRDGVKDPNFFKVLLALQNCNKARVTRSGRVYFNANVRRRLHDQWFKPYRKNQTTLSQSNGSSPAPFDSLEATVPGPEGGVRGRRKLAKIILQRLNSTDRSVFIADKFGVRVFSEVPVEDGKIQICVDRAEVYELKLFVENTGQEVVYFTYYTPLHWLQCFTLEDSKKVTRDNPLCLEPREQYEVTVRFKSNHVGVYLATLAFEFKRNTQATTQPFHIMRFIEAVYRTKLATLLGPVEPFKPLRLDTFQPENCTVDEGVPPEGFVQNFLKTVMPLGQYTPPIHISELAKLLKNNCTSWSLRGKFQELKLVSVKLQSWNLELPLIF